MTIIARVSGVAAILFVVSVRLARAEDTGAIMAALKDEDSECRYYRQLCDDARQAFAELPAATERTKGGDIAAGQGALDRTLTRARAVHEAKVVLQSKHASPPACIHACDGLID